MTPVFLPHPSATNPAVVVAYCPACGNRWAVNVFQLQGGLYCTRDSVRLQLVHIESEEPPEPTPQPTLRPRPWWRRLLMRVH